MGIEHTRAALARFERQPAHWLRRLCAAMTAYHAHDESEPVSDPAGGPYRAPVRRASPRLLGEATYRAMAARAGFVRIGSCFEGVLVFRLGKDVWVSPDHMTQLHIHRSIYFLATYFDDGACLLTWSRPQPTPSSGMLESIVGTGDVERDSATHAGAIAKLQAEGTRAPLYVNDVETAVALGRHYWRDVVPLHIAAMQVLGGVALIALPLYIVLRLLARFLA
jgi:hypothetical protein